MPGYFVFELDIFDPAGFSLYANEARDLLRDMGGEIVLNSTRVAPVEGGWNPPALVMAKFPTLEAAQRFYDCDAYQGLLALRNRAAHSRGVLVESGVPSDGGELASNAAPTRDGAGAASFGLDYTRGMTGFRPAADPRIEERVLGLGAASGGAVSAKLLRARGAAGVEPFEQHCAGHCVLYVVRGAATLHEASTGEHALCAGSAVYLPCDWRYRLANWSFDFEVIALYAEARSSSSSREAVFDHERPHSYVQGPPGREYLYLRPLRLADRTDRQLEVTLIKGRGAPADGTGWHTHTNSEWVYILSGAAELGSEEMGNLTIRAGDSLTFPPASVHSVHTFSEDYALLAVNAPADFKTHRATAPTTTQSKRTTT
ncbi:MAG TPA: DUF1330 domain-containing protein [Ramlibacter sp.]|nr:DUF1330 domain-containing protein [Ramlibacter sp.]